MIEKNLNGAIIKYIVGMVVRYCYMDTIYRIIKVNEDSQTVDIMNLNDGSISYNIHVSDII